MDVKMNSELINETVDDVVSTVNFLCKNDLSYLELTTKLDVLNEKMDTLQTLVVYSNDDKFTKTICAMQLITDNFNDEISKDFGVTFSNDFKERQLNFLRNISSSFDVNIIEVDNIDSLSNTKENIHKQYTKKVDKTKKEYQKENTKQTVDDIIKATNDKLNSYFESKEDIKEYLKYMSKFHNYSIGNCAKIEEQFSGARAVGSFKFWKDNGFTVNKGEKGIQILIPTPIKNFYDEEGNIKRVYFATKEQKEKLKKGILKDAPPEDMAKIPKELMEALENKKDKDYKFETNSYMSFENEDISETARAMLMGIFREYIMKPQEDKTKQEFEEDVELEENTENNIEDIVHQNKDQEQEEQLALVEVKKESLYRKIINFFKKLFHVKQKEDKLENVDE